MTREEQRAATGRGIVGLAAIGAITIAASVDALRIGPAAAGLLYLLPVLWASARAGLPVGLASAGSAALCYNFFLLEPRYTLRIHGVDDVAAFLVLTLVAVVTSRLASDLRAREVEARARADASAAEAAFTRLLTRVHDRTALDRAALEFVGARFGEAHLVRGDDLAAKRSGLAPLDAAAAAWALHHGALSGHASGVMPSADYRFVPIGRGSEDVLAIAADPVANDDDGDLPTALSRIWAQARDRLVADEERQARAAADKREQLRRTLLAALGHDFRTPLTVLKSGLAELGGSAAARLGAEVDRMIRLSEDLLAAARLDGQTAVSLEPVDLVDTVAAVLPARGGDEAAICVRACIPDDLPLVSGDAVMLVHLLGNLVDNAIRHARTAVVVEAVAHDDRVRLEVRDDGSGVDPAVADTLFDRFVSGSDRHGSSGLGLAIAHDLARAMGAELSAGRAPEGGASFTVIFAATDALAAPA